MCAVLTAGYSLADSVVLFNDFGPADQLSDNFLQIGGAFPGFPGQRPAFAFVPTATAALDQLDLALGVFGTSHGLTISLTADSAGQPGSVLESLSVSVSAFEEIVPIQSVTHPLLVEGTQYWLTATPTDFNDSYVWWVPSILDLGTRASQFGGSDVWTVTEGRLLGGFDITGNAPSSVPEPASGALTIVGATALLAFRRNWFAKRFRSSASTGTPS